MSCPLFINCLFSQLTSYESFLRSFSSIYKLSCLVSCLPFLVFSVDSRSAFGLFMHLWINNYFKSVSKRLSLGFTVSSCDRCFERQLLTAYSLCLSSFSLFLLHVYNPLFSCFLFVFLISFFIL